MTGSGLEPCCVALTRLLSPAWLDLCDCPTEAGISTQTQGKATFNFGAGDTVGASAQFPLPWDKSPGSGGASMGLDNLSLGRIRGVGAGAGLQLSVGVVKTVTIATPALFP